MQTIALDYGVHDGGTKWYALIPDGTGGGFALWGGRGKQATICNYGRQKFSGLMADKEARGYSFTRIRVEVPDPQGKKMGEAILDSLSGRLSMKGYRGYHDGVVELFNTWASKAFGTAPAVVPEKPLSKVAFAEKASADPLWGAF